MVCANFANLTAQLLFLNQVIGYELDESAEW